MKIPYFCCIGAELKRYAQDFDFMNQVYLYKVPTDDTMEEVLAQDYFEAVADTVLQDDIVYIYEPTTEMLYTCHFNKQNGHITAEQMSDNIPSLTPDKILISDATGHITAGDVSLDFVKNKLTDLENNKVNINGSSTMTGPLKFKAGSFSGAIAGGLGDGVSIYKIKTDGTIDSEVASLTKRNGFIPGTTNAQNIGSSTLKWKSVYTGALNNGADLVVPNKAGTLATMDDVELAARSGTQLTDQGVWYAKMHAATVPPAAENGTNYADFSQVDTGGNPIIVLYERQNGAWVETDIIVPPAEYDGYVLVTSKIWDVTEQAGQQGGRILWNHQSKEFTPYPQIISFEDIEITGDSTVQMPAAPTSASITNKGYVDNALSGKADSATTLAGYGITDAVAKGHEVIAFQAPTAQNNYTWYRKYADGWVEQGGMLSYSHTSGTTTNWEANFAVPMADTNYTASSVHRCPFTLDMMSSPENIGTARLQGYLKGNHTQTVYIYWVVYGMAAS